MVGYETPHESNGPRVGIYLYWIPLGAGGTGFVRMNGRIYEAIKARLDRRQPLDLYHTALEVHDPKASTSWRRCGPAPMATPSREAF